LGAMFGVLAISNGCGLYLKPATSKYGLSLDTII
jgi:hypothetical protein